MHGAHADIQPVNRGSHFHEQEREEGESFKFHLSPGFAFKYTYRLVCMTAKHSVTRLINNARRMQVSRVRMTERHISPQLFSFQKKKKFVYEAQEGSVDPQSQVLLHELGATKKR